MLLVSAAGRGFSAGRDIGGAQPGTGGRWPSSRRDLQPLVQRVADLPFPTVAAVQPCLGTGLGLALACDVVLAADTAKFGSPFAKIGALDSGAHKAFVERLGPTVALDLIYSGRPPGRAAAAGLVSRVVPAGVLADTAQAYAHAIAKGPARLAESKRLVREISDTSLTLARVLELEAAAQSRSSATHDYVEGFTAFLERREPAFKGE